MNIFEILILRYTDNKLPIFIKIIKGRIIMFYFVFNYAVYSCLRVFCKVTSFRKLLAWISETNVLKFKNYMLFEIKYHKLFK